MPLNQPVKLLMKHTAIRDISETEPITKAIELLDQHDISALPVRSADGSKYCGVLSKSDIASRRFLKLLQQKTKPAAITVREVMNRTQPLFVMEDNSIQEAVELLHRCHIHRLFVADPENQLVGVISNSDILRMLVVNKNKFS